MPYKIHVRGTLRKDGAGRTLQIDRNNEKIVISFWEDGRNPDQHSATSSWGLTLREFCEELGIVPGDVPPDRGERGY